MEIILALVISLAMLIVICIIVCLVLLKDTKDFRIHFDLLKGFDISGSFFAKETTTRKHK